MLNQLTFGLIKTKGNFDCGGTNSLTPNFGGRDCDLRWPFEFNLVKKNQIKKNLINSLPIACCSTDLAGDLGNFLSASGINVAIVIKPIFALPERNGILSRVVSFNLRKIKIIKIKKNWVYMIPTLELTILR